METSTPTPTPTQTPISRAFPPETARAEDDAYHAELLRRQEEELTKGVGRGRSAPAMGEVESDELSARKKYVRDAFGQFKKLIGGRGPAFVKFMYDWLPDVDRLGITAGDIIDQIADAPGAAKGKYDVGGLKTWHYMMMLAEVCGGETPIDGDENSGPARLRGWSVVDEAAKADRLAQWLAEGLSTSSENDSIVGPEDFVLDAVMSILENTPEKLVTVLYIARCPIHTFISLVTHHPRAPRSLEKIIERSILRHFSGLRMAMAANINRSIGIYDSDFD